MNHNEFTIAKKKWPESLVDAEIEFLSNRLQIVELLHKAELNPGAIAEVLFTTDPQHKDQHLKHLDNQAWHRLDGLLRKEGAAYLKVANEIGKLKGLKSEERVATLDCIVEHITLNAFNTLHLHVSSSTHDFIAAESHRIKHRETGAVAKGRM